MSLLALRMVAQRLHTWPALTALVGLSIPVGYVLYSYIPHMAEMTLQQWGWHLWTAERALLLYLAVPTTLVYATFGYLGAIQMRHVMSQRQLMEEFLHMAAHDIRAPLAVIGAATQMLITQVKGATQDEAQDLVAMIVRQAHVMQELVSELLDLHKMESGQVELQLSTERIDELARRACDEMTFLVVHHRVRVEYDVRVPDPVVMVDRFRIRQVFRNLLSNALKHMPEGGVVRITIDRRDRHELQVGIYNDGPPIPAERLPHLFEKFSQTSRGDVEFGVGLGLAICRRIVTLHSGRIWAENAPAGGVEFTFTLPSR